MTDGKPLDDQALDKLFRTARSYNGWQDKDVPDEWIHKIYDLMKWGPTSGNSCPLRIVFVRTKEAKEKLKPLLAKGNQDKTMEAPVIALFAMDRKFFQYAGKLAPHVNVEAWYVGKDEANKETANLNGTLQAAYFMLAARSLGLDCGPMSGINAPGIKDAFFPDLDGEVKFVCSLGFGRPETLYPRAQRLDFDEVAKFV
jgi:3-hydroxypropanoate dehydrogenase